MSKKLKREIKKTIIGAVVFAIGFATKLFLPDWVSLLFFAVSYGVLAYDVLLSAGRNIIHGQVFDENFLMTLATIGAIICREYSEAVAVMLFYKVGECFQSYAVNKSRKSIKALMAIRPDFARVVRGNEEIETDPSNVCIDESIIIRPGERIPLDGEVISGVSSVDTAAITGESMPRDVAVGDNVVSGCVNLSGVLTVRVMSTYSESTVSKVLKLVEDATGKKAKAEQFITVFARYYTPIVVISALLLAVVGSVFTGDLLTWFYRAATFLLISCPCALVISIPLSFFGGIGGAGKKGILIKGGNYMDSLSKVDTLVLDKTGTITKGNFVIEDIEVSDSFKEEFGEKAKDKLIEFAAYAESYSSHPIAVSILNRFGKEPERNNIGEVSEIAGKGVKASVFGRDVYVGNKKLMEDVIGNVEISILDKCSSSAVGGTLVYVALGNMFAGHLHIADEIKEGAIDFVKKAKKSGIRNIIMLTGDNEVTAAAVSEKVGLDGFFANLTPEGKVNEFEKLLADNEGKVAFIGDGINDAPVLARADVGIAMGAMGSDAAIEAADVVIMTDELSKIVTAKEIAVKTIRIVKENIVFALGVKLLVLVLAAFGAAHMWAAIFADVGVAFLAISNSMRALKG